MRTGRWLCLLLLVSPPLLAEDGLAQIERSIAASSSIAQVSTAQIERGLSSRQGSVLFDVREEKEFEVSHLEGAIRLDPQSDPGTFLSDYGALLGERPVVFYCSTGRRSTELAEEVADEIAAEGKALPLPANMKGGIFRWHNEKKPLVNDGGSTDFVHPYNWYWKRLLKRKDKARYSPE